MSINYLNNVITKKNPFNNGFFSNLKFWYSWGDEYLKFFELLEQIDLDDIIKIAENIRNKLT